MDKTISVWGGAKGKLLAAFIVLGVVFGAIALSLSYAVHANVLLDSDEVVVSSSSDNGNNSVTVKLRIEKSGFYLSKVKTVREEDKLIVKLYASVEGTDKYKTDISGSYTLSFDFDADVKTIVQEDSDGETHTLVTLNHKS